MLTWNSLVPFDHLAVVNLGHVQIDSQGDRDQVGEQQDEPECRDDGGGPGPVEAFKDHHDGGQRDGQNEEQLKARWDSNQCLRIS